MRKFAPSAREIKSPKKQMGKAKHLACVTIGQTVENNVKIQRFGMSIKRVGLFSD